MAKVKAKKSEIVVETKKDIKKKEKRIKLQNQKDTNDTETEVKRFISILVALLIVVGLLYFLANKGSNNTEAISSTNKINTTPNLKIIESNKENNLNDLTSIKTRKVNVDLY